MSVIRICPYRTYTEIRPAILKGQGDVTVTGFMECLRDNALRFVLKENTVTVLEKQNILSIVYGWRAKRNERWNYDNNRR